MFNVLAGMGYKCQPCATLMRPVGVNFSDNIVLLFSFFGLFVCLFFSFVFFCFLRNKFAQLCASLQPALSLFIAYPNVTVTPYVTTQLHETEAKNEHNIDFIYKKATFECHADDLQDNYEYEIRWYINDLEIEEAQYTSLSKSDVNGGTGRLHEETWASKFRPNMIVICSMKVRGVGYDSPGPEQKAEAFFAGIEVSYWLQFL